MPGYWRRPIAPRPKSPGHSWPACSSPRGSRQSEPAPGRSPPRPRWPRPPPLPRCPHPRFPASPGLKWPPVPRPVGALDPRVSESPRLCAGPYLERQTREELLHMAEQAGQHILFPFAISAYWRRLAGVPRYPLARRWPRIQTNATPVMIPNSVPITAPAAGVPRIRSEATRARPQLSP